MPLLQKIPSLRMSEYPGIALDEQLQTVETLASSLKGLKVVHVNSTASGGGVAEILRSLVPLMRDVGLDAEWMVMEGNEPFFKTTKKIHNLLQGADGKLTAEELTAYVNNCWNVSKAIM